MGEGGNALTEATRIIVIGFSMPAADTHFKYLLAAGLQNNISLRKFFFINPGLSVDSERAMLENNLFSILRRELAERGIVEKVPLRTNDFFLNRQYLTTISRNYSSKILRIQHQGRDVVLNLG